VRELTITQIDADMLGLSRPEKNEITGLQLVAGYRPAFAYLLIGGPGKTRGESIVKDPLNVGRTVHTTG